MDDLISKQDALDAIARVGLLKKETKEVLAVSECLRKVEKLPSVNPQEPKIGHCKDCKYFDYDSVAKVDGMPFIVAHEICSRWGDECKTKEDGYCFLFEPQESEVRNDII